MQKWTAGRFTLYLARILVGLAVLFIVLVAWGQVYPQSSAAFGWLLGLAGAVCLGVIGIEIYWQRGQTTVTRRMAQLANRMPEMRQRLENIVRFNRVLVEAVDEKELIGQSLEIFASLVGATASAFVQLDEWGHILSSQTYGNLPQMLVKGWSEHLASHSVRLQCQICSATNRVPDAICPRMQIPYGSGLSVYCLHVRRGDLLLGILHVYLEATHELSLELRSYMEGLLNELGYAIYSLRQYHRELNTLRQLQMVRSPQADLAPLMDSLLEGAQCELEASTILLDVPEIDEWRPGIRLVRGTMHQEQQEALQLISEQVQITGETWNKVTEVGGVLAMPVRLQDGRFCGVLLARSETPQVFSNWRVAVLEKIALQSAQLLDNQRIYLELEYKAVMNERTRLAREIHDGLAQTLAFLKMQTAQMKTYQQRGDEARLHQAIEQNSEALSDAYLDIRQVIDNLRLAPQPVMHTWVEQLLDDFEHSSGLKVERNIAQNELSMPPEAQSQLLRILQEVLSNIRKHSHAKRVRVSFRRLNNDLVLEIGDDGQGFSIDEVPELSQYGLRGMRERAELIGAEIQITSQPNEGTVVHLSIPVTEEEANP